MWGFGRALRGLGQSIGPTEIVLWGCGALYLLSLLLDTSGIRFGGPFGFLAPSLESLRSLGASGAIPVLGEGSWWTLLSAGWLHGGLLHVLFNMMWVRQLGPITTALYGPGRMLLIYLIASVTGFFASSVLAVYLPFLNFLFRGPSGFSVGASAAVFGLLGAVVYAGRRGLAAQLGRQMWGYAIVLFFFGLVMPGVDNWAHLGGFLGGYGLAKLFDPLRPEKTDHLVVAMVLLALTVVSVLVSFVRVVL
jgi:rhomboid protease GluP